MYTFPVMLFSGAPQLVTTDDTNDVITLYNGLTSEVNTTLDISGVDIQPTGVAFNTPSQDLFLIGNWNNKVFQMDGKTATVQNSFSTPGGVPTGITIHNGDVYTCDSTAGAVYQHSGVASATVVSSISVASNPHDITFDSDGNLAVYSDGNQRVDIHSKFTATVNSSFSTGTGRYYGLATDGAGNLVSAETDGSTYSINFHDGFTATVNSSISMPRSMKGVAIA